MIQEDLATLYHELCDTRFGCVPPGEHHIHNVYTLVQDRYPELCDDSYLCSQNCKNGHNKPEWQHRVRAALDYLKRNSSTVRPGEESRHWHFGASVATKTFQLLATDIEAPTPKRVETMTFRILRDTALANQIKDLHRHECQICGLTIHLPDGAHYAEAHHIQPLGSPHDGPDVAGNIIVLCPNHHAMFDFGTIPLELNKLQSHKNHEIDARFVNYHNTIIYRKTILKP